LELTVEKMVYGGEGLARTPSNRPGLSKTVFVPFVLPGEKISASEVEAKSSYSRAKASHILESSALRVQPRCPYFERCGGCHYQHTSYENQLAIKEQVLRETLARTAKIRWEGEVHVHASPPWNYRNRTRLHVSSGDGGHFAMGYFRFGTHELLPVEECPISSPLINRAISVLWNAGRSGLVPRSVRELELFSDADDQHLLLEIYLLEAPASEDLSSLEKLAEHLEQHLPELMGMAGFALERDFGTPQRLWTHGATKLRYKTQSGEYTVRVGSFFQVNRMMTEKLVDLVVTGEKGSLALDLYAGTGLFSLPLARNFEKVYAVEPAPPSFADLEANSPENVRPVSATTVDFLRLEGKSLRPGFVVADPPRAGLGEKVTRSLAAMGAPRITYVSCDPTTLARDLGILLESGSGYQIESIHLVDLFPQTYHLETVVKLTR